MKPIVPKFWKINVKEMLDYIRKNPVALNKKGIDHIKEWEGVRLSAYIPVKGDRPTIGYGNTFYPDGTPVKMGDKITKSEAEGLLREIVKKFENGVNRLVNSQINQNQFNALVSFSYNVGIESFKNSTLLKRVNANPNDFDEIEVQFKRWNKSGGRVYQGLVKRRKSEFEMYSSKK